MMKRNYLFMCNAIFRIPSKAQFGTNHTHVSRIHSFSYFKKFFGSSHLKTEKAASEIFSCMKKEIAKDDIVMDFNPGSGHFSNCVLSLTSNPLVVCVDSNPKFPILSLKEKYPGRVHTSEDFSPVSLYYKNYYDRYKAHCLSNIVKTLYKKNSTIRIFCTVHKRQFFYIMLNGFSLIFTTNLPRNVVWYFCVDKSILRLLTKGKTAYSRRVFVPFSCYFDIKLLKKIPKSSFHPVGSWKGDPSQPLNLIRISTKKNLFEKITPKELKNFAFFIASVLRTPTNTTFFDFLEQHIVNGGEEMIKNGFNVFQSCVDFTQDEWLTAYKVFSSLPMYEDSFFSHHRKSKLLTCAYFIDDFSEHPQFQEECELDFSPSLEEMSRVFFCKRNFNLYPSILEGSYENQIDDGEEECLDIPEEEELHFLEDGDEEEEFFLDKALY